jgi:hypothetical protein
MTSDKCQEIHSGPWRVDIKTIHTTLHKNLQLSKKSARWPTKLLIEEMKKERVRMCEALVAIIAAVGSK